jgi:hypothetical protein
MISTNSLVKIAHNAFWDLGPVDFSSPSNSISSVAVAKETYAPYVQVTRQEGTAVVWLDGVSSTLAMLFRIHNSLKNLSVIFPTIKIHCSCVALTFSTIVEAAKEERAATNKKFGNNMMDEQGTLSTQKSAQDTAKIYRKNPVSKDRIAILL